LLILAPVHKKSDWTVQRRLDCPTDRLVDSASLPCLRYRADVEISIEAHKALIAALKQVRQRLGLPEDRQVDLLSISLRPALGIDISTTEEQQIRELRALLRLMIERSREDYELLSVAYNLNDTSDDWTTRLENLAALHSLSSKTVVRRIDGAISRLAEALLSPISEDRWSPYRLQLGKFPELVTRDGLDHVHIILGTTPRERDGTMPDLNAAQFSLELSGKHVDIRRQVVAGTVRDIVRVADLCVTLAGICGDRVSTPTELCVADIAVSSDQLRDHLIIVGGPDTNIFMALASRALRETFGAAAPIRYAGEDSGYFTCDEIISDVSGARYPRLEELGAMHVGYIVLASNPWNSERTITLVSGTRATGTQAALLALTRSSDMHFRSGNAKEHWRTLGGNNRYDPTIACKVVRATKARIVSGDSLLSASSIIDVPAHSRIPQRHAITDFAFEE
jgi:hypothetical protein